MKFLYRMNSAPAGRYYDEDLVRSRVPVINRAARLYNGVRILPGA